MYQTCIASMDDLKHRWQTELAKVDHVTVIVAAIRHWPNRLSACVKASADISNTACVRLSTMC